MQKKPKSSKALLVMASKGEIWLANLNPQKRDNEIGKRRPVIVIQSDFLNNSSYPTTIVIPLTTRLIDDAKPLRMRINKREKLQEDSDALIAHIRSIDNARFIEKLACLKEKELAEILQCLYEVLD